MELHDSDEKKKIESGVQEFFVYSIRLFQIFRAFHFIFHFHNKLKTKLRGQENGAPPSF